MKDYIKIAYLIHWTPATGFGVVKKVTEQVQEWLRQDNEVHVFMVGKQVQRAAEWLAEKGFAAKVFYFPYDNLTERVTQWTLLTREIVKAKPDLIYFRYDLYMPQMEILFRFYPTVVELNTNDVAEFCLVKNARCLYNAIFRHRTFALSRGFVAVSNEIAGLVRQTHKPTKVIANGISLRNYPVLPPPADKQIRLAFLGSPGQTWHGVDKIVALARHFKEWHFHVIGPDQSEIPEPPPNVMLHGYLDQPAIEGILAQCTAGIGPMAIERKKMKEGSPLKVREYLAYGLPVITSHRDTDFPEGSEFILQIPSTSEVTSLASEIKAFVQRWFGKRVPRERIAHIDTTVKEVDRLCFFRRILSDIGFRGGRGHET